MIRRSPALVAPVLVLVLAACSGAATTPSPAASPTTSDAASAAAPASAAAASTAVTITLVEYAFEPDNLTVPAGEITFILNNEGSEQHEFEIFLGDQVVDEVEGLIPGLERDLTVTLEPGDYTYVCKLADHEQRGMTGTLTVTGA